jgi:hypothetical protein
MRAIRHQGVIAIIGIGLGLGHDEVVFATERPFEVWRRNGMAR